LYETGGVEVISQADCDDWLTGSVWPSWRSPEVTALNRLGSPSGDWLLGVTEAAASGGPVKEGRGTGERLPDRVAR
jgi:transcription elongation factor